MPSSGWIDTKGDNCLNAHGALPLINTIRSQEGLRGACPAACVACLRSHFSGVTPQLSHLLRTGAQTPVVDQSTQSPCAEGDSSVRLLSGTHMQPDPLWRL